MLWGMRTTLKAVTVIATISSLAIILAGCAVSPPRVTFPTSGYPSQSQTSGQHQDEAALRETQQATAAADAAAAVAAQQAAAAAAVTAQPVAQPVAQPIKAAPIKQATTTKTATVAPKTTVAPAAPIKCPAGSQANSGDAGNDTSCFPVICFTIVLPDPAHPECVTPFKP